MSFTESNVILIKLGFFKKIHQTYLGLKVIKMKSSLNLNLEVLQKESLFRLNLKILQMKSSLNLNLKVHQANQRGRHQLSVGDVYSGPLIQNPEQYQVSDPRTDHGCQIEEHDTFMRLDATKHIAFLQPVVR